MKALAKAVLRADQAHLVRRLQQNALGPAAAVGPMTELRRARHALLLDVAGLQARGQRLSSHPLETEALILSLAIERLVSATLQATSNNLQEAKLGQAA